MNKEKVKESALRMERVWNEWMDSKSSFPCTDFWYSLDILLRDVLGRRVRRTEKVEEK